MEHLHSDTTQATLSLTTDLAATCRFATTAGVTYDAMTNTFATTGGTAHSTVVTGLQDGGVTATTCAAWTTPSGSSNTDDYAISFSVAKQVSFRLSRRAAVSAVLKIRCRRTACGARRVRGPACRRTMGCTRHNTSAVALADAGGGPGSVCGDHLRSGSGDGRLARGDDASAGSQQRQRLSGHRLRRASTALPDQRRRLVELHLAGISRRRSGDGSAPAAAGIAGLHAQCVFQQCADDHLHGCQQHLCGRTTGDCLFDLWQPYGQHPLLHGRRSCRQWWRERAVGGLDSPAPQAAAH